MNPNKLKTKQTKKKQKLTLQIAIISLTIVCSSFLSVIGHLTPVKFDVTFLEILFSCPIS